MISTKRGLKKQNLLSEWSLTRSIEEMKKTKYYYFQMWILMEMIRDSEDSKCQRMDFHKVGAEQV